MRVLFSCIFLTLTYMAFRLLVIEDVSKNYDLRGSLKFSSDVLMQRVKPDSVKVVIMGDSALQAGLIPSEISSGAYNFSSFTADPRLILHEYKKLISKNQKPPRCFIGGFFYTYEMRYVDDLFYTAHMYFDYYTFGEAVKIYNDSRELDVFPARDIISAEYYMKVIAAKMKFYGLTFSQLQNSLWPGSNASTLKSLQKRVIMSRGFFGTNNSQDLEQFFSNTQYFDHGFQPELTYDLYLDRLIQEVTSKGSKFIFVIMPIYFSDKSIVEKKYLDDLEQHVLLKEKKFAQFKLFRARPLLNRGYFYNMNHLNYFGAKLISQDLQKFIGNECN